MEIEEILLEFIQEKYIHIPQLLILRYEPSVSMQDIYILCPNVWNNGHQSRECSQDIAVCHHHTLCKGKKLKKWRQNIKVKLFIRSYSYLHIRF